MHSLAVRLVPDESGHQAPQTDESDHERQERLRELSPHTSPLLLVFPFRGPPLSVSLPPCPAFTLRNTRLFYLPCPVAYVLIFPNSVCTATKYFTSTHAGSVKAVNLFPHACLLFYALITPASLAHSLPVSFASLVQIPPR